MPLETETYNDDPYDDDESQGGFRQRKSNAKSRTPVLDNFSTDLTVLLEDSLPILNDQYEKEIELLKYLLFRKNHKPIIIAGESNIIRTTIFKELMGGIILKEAKYRVLRNYRVVILHISSLLKGLDTFSKISERFDAIKAEIEKNTNIILCIDDFEYIMNITFKIYFYNYFLLNPKQPVICYTSPHFIENYFDNYIDLKKHFNIVNITFPIPNRIEKFLMSKCEALEEFHHVAISEEIVKYLINLIEQKLENKLQLEIIIELLDIASAIAHLENILLPPYIEHLEKQIEEVRMIKNESVKFQKYEKATDLRDHESKLVRQLEFAKVQFEEEVKKSKKIIQEDHIDKAFNLYLNA